MHRKPPGTRGNLDTMKEESKIRSLTAAWCDDTISDDEVRELDGLLKNNDDGQRLFAQLNSLNATLEQLGPVPLANKVVPIAARASNPVSKSQSLRVILEIAAVFVAIASVIWAFNATQTANRVEATLAEQQAISAPGFALLTHVIEPVWAKGGRPLREGSTIGRERLRLESGLVHLQFFNGVKVVLEGKTDFEVRSGTESYCWLGKFRASVPPHAKEFIVQTPAGELVDYGTEYGLEVGADGSSEIHVFDGEVVFRNSEQKELAQLIPGEATKIDSAGKPMPLVANSSQFATHVDLLQFHAFERERQFQRWYLHSTDLRRDDPRVLAYYDFDSPDSYLTGVIPAESNDPYSAGLAGVIVGAERTTGRWPAKAGLLFSRTSDRVRVRIPGYYDALTLSAWVRPDQILNRNHGLLLSDEIDSGGFHWKFHGGTGKISLTTELSEGETVSYETGRVLHAEMSGEWVHFACVYDRTSGTVAHFFNGEQVSKRTAHRERPASRWRC